MKYAVVSVGSKQFKVSEGDVIEIDRIEAKPKDKYTFPDILLYVNGQERRIGTPKLSGVKVKAEIIAQTKGEKITVRKYKAKVRYRRTTGHRAMKTKIKIQEISGDNKKGENSA